MTRIFKSWIQGIFNPARKNRRQPARRIPLELTSLESRITPASTLDFSGTVLSLVSNGAEDETITVSTSAQNLIFESTVGKTITVSGNVAGATVNSMSKVTVDLSNAAYAGANLTLLTLNGQYAFAQTTTFTLTGIDFTAVTGTTEIGLTVQSGLQDVDTDLNITGSLKTKGAGEVTVIVNKGSSDVVIDLNGDITTNSGNVTISAADVLNTAGDITTSNGSINIPSFFSLTGNVVFDTNATSGAGDITLAAVDLNNNNLTLETGNAVANADVSGTSVTGAGTLALANIGGTASFSGAVSATALTVPNTVVNFSSTGTGGTITNAVAFANTGTLTLGQATGTQNYNGGITNSSSVDSITLKGTIATNGQILDFISPVILASDTTLNSGSSGLSLVNVDGGFSLDLQATGVTFLTGKVGDSTPLASLTIDTGSAGTVIIGGFVKTTGNQNYNEAIYLDADTTLETGATGNINIVSTVDGRATSPPGSFSLTLNSPNTTTLGGAVGNTTTIKSMTSNAGGTTAINGGSVKTTGAQTYNDAVTIGNNTTFSAGTGNITFDKTVNGGFFLDLNSTGTTTFNGIVGGTAALTTLTTNALGTTVINSGSVTTTGNQFYNDAVTLGADTTLDAGTGFISLGSTVDGNKALTLTTTGTTTLNGAVGGGTKLTTLTINAPSITLKSGTVTTTGDQAYNGFITLQANTTLDAGATGNITLAGANGPFSLDLKSGAATTLGGNFGPNVTTLTTDTGGTTAINSTSVTTTGAQTYNDAVTIGADATLQTTATGNIAFISTVDGKAANTQSLTLNAVGTIAATSVGATTSLKSLTIANSNGATFTGAVTTGTSVVISNTAAGKDVIFQGALTTPTLTVAATANAYNMQILGNGTDITNAVTFNNTGALTLGQAAGTQNYNGGLTTTAVTGTVTLNGTFLTSDDAITLGAVTLGANTTLDTNATTTNKADITLGAVTGATFDLNLETGAVADANVTGTSVSGVGALALANIGGTASFSGDVSATTVALTSVSTASFSGKLDATTLTVPNTVVNFSSTGTGGTIGTASFDNTGTLTLGQSEGTQNYTGGLNTTAVGGTVTLNGTFATTDTAITLGAVTLGSDTTLNTQATNTNKADITLGAVTGGGDSLTLQTGAVADANVTGTSVSGVGTLALAIIGGTASFSGDVSATTVALTSVSTAFFSGKLDATTLTVPNTVVNFSSTGTGGTIGTASFDNTGTLTLGKATGTQTFTNGLNTTQVDGTVTLLGTFATNDTAITLGAITLGANTTFTAGAGNITFGSTVDGAFQLVANSSGTTTFNGIVGGSSALNSLTTNPGGSTVLNGGTILTLGDQTFNDAVTLGANTTLNAGPLGNIAFGSTLDGTFSLNASSDQNTTFGGIVGGTSALTTLTTSIIGTTIISGGGITTTGNQNYNDTVTISADATLTSSGSNITFVQAVNGIAPNTQSLTLNALAGTITGTSVGNTISLKTLTIANSNGTSFSGGIQTGTSVVISDTAAGKDVIFQGALTTPTLTVTSTANAYNVQILGTGTDITNSVTFNNTGTVTLGDDKADILLLRGGLTSTTPTNTFLSGTVRSSAGAMSIEDLSLNSDSVLDSTNNGANPGGAPITLAGATNLNGFNLDIFSGPGNGLTVTGNVALTDGELIVNQGDLNLGDGTTVTTVTVTEDTLFQVLTGALSVKANASIDGDTNDLTFQADTINLDSAANSIATTGTVTLMPVASGRNIFLGTAAPGPQGININQVQFNTIASSASDVIIGNPTYSGTLTMGTLTSSNKLTILNRGGGGKVIVNGTFTSAAGDNGIGLEIQGSGATTVLNAKMVTAGTIVSIDDAVQIDAATVTIDTTAGGTVPTGANVTITGGTRGIFSTSGESNDLIVNAGTNGFVNLGALVGFSNNATLASLVNDVTVSAAQLDLPNLQNSISGTLLADSVDAVMIGEIDASLAINLSPTGVLSSGDLTAVDAITLNAGGNGTVGTLKAGGNISVTGLALGLNGDITTTTGSVALTGPATLGGNTSITGPGGITLNSSVTGTGDNLVLDSGAAGNITTGAAAAISGINLLIINNTNSATIGGTVSAQQVAIQGATSSVGFTGDLNVAGAFNAASGLYSIALFGTSNTIGGPAQFLNTSSLFIGNDNLDTTLFLSSLNRGDQTLLQGTIAVIGDLTLGNYGIFFPAGAMSLVANNFNLPILSLNVSQTANYTLVGNGSGNMDSITGEGAVTLSGNPGSSYNLVDITADSLTTNANPFSININGSSTITQPVTFLNTAGVNLGNESTDTFTFNGGLSSTVSTTTLNGTIASSNDAITLGGASKGVVLAGDSTINSGGGAITLGAGGLNAGNFSLTLDAGTTGAIAANGAVSGFNTLTVANSNGTTFSKLVTGSTLAITDTTDAANVVFAEGSHSVILGSLVTTSQGYGIQLLNAATLINTTVTFNNTGGVVAGNFVADSINLLGGAQMVAGTLSGSGTINGPVFVLPGATVAPGNSPGILTFLNGLTFSPGSTFSAEINGVTTPGVDYDQAVVVGEVALNNATLSTTSSGVLTPNFGDVITLISNDGADEVTGTFAGLPENSQVTVGGATFTLSYEGGDGNDVVLEFIQRQGIVVSSGLAAAPSGVVSSIITITSLGNPSPIVVTPFPYFTGDLHVATGDLNNDGTDDVIVGAGPGAGPAVAIFDGTTGAALSAFFPYDPAFHGGVFVATGDLNGDNILEIITGAGPGGGPHVTVFNSSTFTSQGGFFAYDTAFTGGVTVAAGDFNTDGIDEIATGVGAGGGPNVRIFSGPGFGFSMLQSFFAYAPNFTGGIFVAAGDFSGDNGDELITGAGAGGGPQVTIFNASNSQALASFFAYDIAFQGGVRVGATDYLGDGEVDIITGPGIGGAPHVKIFSDVDTVIDQFFSGDINYRAGIFVSGGPGVLALPD